jgi:hypothetical protein
MRIVLLGVLACVIVCGCKKSDESAVKWPSAGPPGSGQAGPQGGITPLGVGAGAMTPVTGSENLGGSSGGSIGQAAKDRARNTQNQATTAAPEDDGDGQ